jgi:hypothetical protein
VLTIELGEDAVNANLHSSSGRRHVDSTLVDRVQAHAVALEEPHQPTEVTGVPRESIELPDDDSGDLVRLDERQEPLQIRAVEVLA